MEEIVIGNKMLEKIFTSKTRIKILEFLFFNKKESHLREISKELGIPVSTTKREIDNLTEIGIIKKQQNKISLNQKCNILEELKNIFIKTDFLIYPIKKVLKNIKAEFILIFGSFARGNYSNESDIDLLVIGSIKPSKVYDSLDNAEKIVKRTINPIVWGLKELKENKEKGFVKDIFKKKIIMIKGEENELRRIIKK